MVLRDRIVAYGMLAASRAAANEVTLPPEPPWFWDTDVNAPDPDLERLSARGFGPADDNLYDDELWS